MARAERFDPRRAAVAAVFFAVGVMLGTWLACVPQWRAALGIDYAQLGLVLLAQTVGVIAAMPLAGRLAGRVGHRAVVWTTAVAVPWFPLLAAVAPGAAAAAGGMLAWGLVAGLLDVAMNTQGVQLERALGRPVLNGLHAAWGLGALIGSLGSVLAGAYGWSLRTHLLIIALVLSVLMLAVGRALPRDPDRAAPGPGPRPAPVGLTGGWTRVIAVLGILGASVALCEGAASSWCGVFLQGARGAAPDVASLGYFAFVVGETGVRTVGDRLHRKYGAKALVRRSMMVSAVAVLAAVTVPYAWAGVAAFALQGCGLAVALPIISSAVGHSVPGDPGPAIARYSTLYYIGVLTGPALFGWAAQSLGIGVAFGLLALPLGVITLLAGAVAPAAAALRAAPAARPATDRIREDRTAPQVTDHISGDDIVVAPRGL